MTSRRTWKKYEQNIAEELGTKRTPLSGENSRHTSSDTLHDEFYVEAKMRDSMNKFLCKLMRDTVEECEEKSTEEDKEWFIVFREKYKQTNYALLDFDFLLQLMEEAGRLDE